MDEGRAEQALSGEEDDLEEKVTVLAGCVRGHRDERDPESAPDRGQDRGTHPVEKRDGKDDGEVEEGKGEGAREDQKRV
jgi:hypothetical protein